MNLLNCWNNEYVVKIYRRDFLAGLLDVLPVAALHASRLFADDVLWNSFRRADNTRSFGRNDIFTLN